MISYGRDYPEPVLDDDDCPLSGSEILDEVRAFIAAYVVMSEAAKDAATLWVAHTHLVERFESSPRLAHLSPEPQSGKTRALEVYGLLVPNPMDAVNATPAALFRFVAALNQPTVLFDEVDTIFGARAKEHEEVRGLLNAGHRRSGKAYRCVGEGTRQEAKAFPAYAAVALAGLGNLPDTLMSRSIVIRMRRRAPHERVGDFRRRFVEPVGHKLRDALASWAHSAGEGIEEHIPDLPPGVTDRPADVWEPLITIGDIAGGDWPKRAREACLELIAEAADADSQSLGVRLLRDLRVVFGVADSVSTEAILEGLHAMDEAPWGDLRGKPLDARGLARILRQYDLRPAKVKLAGTSLQGYRREDLWDAWQRYLPPPAAEAEPPEPAERDLYQRRSEALVEVPDEVPDEGEVPEPRPHPEPIDPALTWTVPQVPQVPDFRQGEGRPSPNSREVAAAAAEPEPPEPRRGARMLAPPPVGASPSQPDDATCPHGMINGAEPDPFVDGYVSCPLCRRAVLNGSRP